MRLTLCEGQATIPGTLCRTICDKCEGSSTSPANHVTLKMQETVSVVQFIRFSSLEFLRVS